MSAVDFYSGFEGEGELVVEHRLQGVVLAQLSAWDGYLSMVMQTIEPEADGWTGFALPYHMVTGWYDGEWVDPDPPDTLAKLRCARSQATEADLCAFIDAFIEIVADVLRAGGELVWRRE